MTQLEFLPATLDGLWKRWLGYRLPHYDHLAQEASTTLTGSRWCVVRVGWDDERRTSDENHATLFTLSAETPDPRETLALAEQFCPWWMKLHHAIVDAPVPRSATPSAPEADVVLQAIEAYMDEGRRFKDLKNDPRILPDVITARALRLRDLRLVAVQAVEDGVRAGLEAREGTFLVPVALVKPEMLEDQFLYEMVLGVRRLLVADGRPWEPDGIGVCTACTMVFVRRRAGTVHCRLCRTRPAQPQVFGQEVWESGRRATIRVPQRVGNVVTGWRSATVGQCPECGKPFAGRRDKRACDDCSNAARQRRHRARRRASPGSHRERPGDL
jgi:hypothetical protein